jgi:hypothetical protein
MLPNQTKKQKTQIKTKQNINVSLAVHHFVRNFGKNAKATKTNHIFQLVSDFQRCITSELHMQHTKLLQSRP